jgi:hypothetical protein
MDFGTFLAISVVCIITFFSALFAGNRFPRGLYLCPLSMAVGWGHFILLILTDSRNPSVSESFAALFALFGLLGAWMTWPRRMKARGDKSNGLIFFPYGY